MIIPPLEDHPHVTEDEAKLIWLQAKKPAIRMLIMTLWFTGLRISEALSLTKSSVRRSGSDYSLAVMTEKVGKTKESKPDIIPIPRGFALDLQDYMNEHIEGGKLFPLHRATAWRQIQRCAKDAGMVNWREVHPHSFRHGFVYDKAKKGVHPYTLSKLARHRDLRTTLGYFQPNEADLREAIEK